MVLGYFVFRTKPQYVFRIFFYPLRTSMNREPLMLGAQPLVYSEDIKKLPEEERNLAFDDNILTCE